MTLGNKEKFLKIYANLPVSVRDEIVVTLDDGRPLSWNAAFFEIDNNTPNSAVILEKLEKLEII